MLVTAVIVLIVAFFFLRALYKTEPAEETLAEKSETHDDKKSGQKDVYVEHTSEVLDEDH